MQFAYYTRLTKENGFQDTPKEIMQTANNPLFNNHQKINYHQAELIHDTLRKHYDLNKLQELMPDDVIIGALDSVIIQINGENVKIKEQLD